VPLLVGRGWPGIHSGDIVTRPEVVVLAQNNNNQLHRDNDGAATACCVALGCVLHATFLLDKNERREKREDRMRGERRERTE
jgi:hypothetical protein